MTRYFFHLFEASVASRDEVGVEFPSVEAAFLDVHQAVLDISQDMRERRDIHHMRFEVCDETGCVMFELPFAEVLDRTDPSRSAFEAKRLNERMRSNLLRNRRLSSDIAGGMAEATERLRYAAICSGDVIRRPTPTHRRRRWEKGGGQQSSKRELRTKCCDRSPRNHVEEQIEKRIRIRYIALDPGLARPPLQICDRF